MPGRSNSTTLLCADYASPSVAGPFKVTARGRVSTIVKELTFDARPAYTPHAQILAPAHSLSAIRGHIESKNMRGTITRLDLMILKGRKNVSIDLMFETEVSKVP